TADTTTAASPTEAADGLKVSNEKRKCHHPRRHPIGPSAKSTRAIPANANASSGTCFRTDCRAVNEVVAIVMTCSSQAVQRREDRTLCNPAMSSRFPATHGRAKRQHDPSTRDKYLGDRLDLRWVGDDHRATSG